MGYQYGQYTIYHTRRDGYYVTDFNGWVFHHLPGYVEEFIRSFEGGMILEEHFRRERLEAINPVGARKHNREVFERAGLFY